jgi:FAD/FMN-containing dehydrogenase/Fe-S oxidoreductase
MDAEKVHLQADLRGILEGDVYFTPIFRQMYASDASIHEIQPLGVVRPRSTQDVSELLRYCSERSIPVFPRGGGSGLAGQALGRGIVVDFSRYMGRIHRPQGDRVRVQAGTVSADLNRTLRPSNLLFGPDPANRSVTTIGSMIAADVGGSHFPVYGSTGDRIESVEVVMADGQVVELSRHPWIGEAIPSESIPEQLARDIGLLLQRNSALIIRPPWGDIVRGCGYRIEKVLDGDLVDLTRLISGSEGTLGLVTEATLKLEAAPKARGLMLLFFARLELAARAAVDLQQESLSACDLMDRRLLEIARETEPVYASIVPRGAEAMLLVEFQGEHSDEVRHHLLQLLQRLQRRGKTVVAYRLTTDTAERDLLWRLARRVVPRLYRLKGSLRPLPFIEDIAVPPKLLPQFLTEIQNVLKAERVTATLFAHAWHGHIDVRPFLDLANSEDQMRLDRLAEALYSKVFEYGGTICGQQAIGLSRAYWAEKQLGPRLDLCRRIKHIFDPNGILNPGKFLSPTPPKVNEHLRSVPVNQNQASSDLALKSVDLAWRPLEPSMTTVTGGSNLLSEDAAASGDLSDTTNSISQDKATNRRELLEFPVLLNWKDGDSLAYSVRSCNGCGRCRTGGQLERMCPVFRVHQGEEASPRAKANLLRGLLTKTMEAEILESGELKEVSDLCFNCHQCRIECPANVNIPKLVQEVKAQHVASHGLPLPERLINRTDLISALGSRFPGLSNWSLANPAMRWLLEKTFGIAQGRKLPKLSRRSFLQWASRERLNRPIKSPGRKVLFFVDQYANWHNPLLGRAFVEVMRHHRIPVYVPTQQKPSFMAMISSGDVQRARKLIKGNIKLLAEGVRQGYEIVTLEPTAALCFQQEYRYLFQNEDTELIANHCSEATAFLWAMKERNELAHDLRPLNWSVIYHQPCHARILYPHQPALQLLRMIPGLDVHFVEAGCSGMAGTYGMQRKNFRTSIRIGRELIRSVRNSTAQMGVTECVACKLQMEQGTTKPTVHPIALLSYSYGRMPELEAWFTSQNSGTVVV